MIQYSFLTKRLKLARTHKSATSVVSTSESINENARLINKHIKDLLKLRTDLRKKGLVGGTTTDSESHRIKEKPLPQRVPRNKPRVISNVQIVSPSKSEEEPSRDDVNREEDRRKVPTGQWTEAKEKRWRSNLKNLDQTNTYSPQPGKPKERNPSMAKESRGSKADTVTRKSPKSAAVMITGKEEDFSYAKALKKARETISLDDKNSN